MKIKEALIDNNISWSDFFNALSAREIGDWDNVNDTYIIEEYISKMKNIGVDVRHIAKALKTENCEYEQWGIWLGNSMNTPFPINTKQDLVDALELSEDDMEKEIEFI